MKIFRHMFLPKNTLEIVPVFCYERNDRASDITIKYLEWISHEEDIKSSMPETGEQSSFHISARKWKDERLQSRWVISNLTTEP